MNNKEIFNNKVNNKESKMNIIEQHNAFYNHISEEDESQLIINNTRKSILQDIMKWVNKFMYAIYSPSKDIQTINNALQTDTTGKSRNEIISKVIKEIADKNYKEIKKIEKQNPNSGLSVIRIDIDECRIKDNIVTIFEGDIATAIQELKIYISEGINVPGTNLVFMNIEDKISPEEQEKTLSTIEKRLKNTTYDWVKIERIPEINKWIVVDRIDNKVIFQAPPEKLNKIMEIIITKEEELADKT